jgi:hypothetical protein
MKGKLFISSNLLFGTYGFSREYRAKVENRFFTEKIGISTLNGIFYTVPPYNIYYLSKLLNRLEIKKRKWDTTDHKDQYTEFFGNICYSTI